MIDLTPLMPLVDPEATADARKEHESLIAGNLGNTQFVVVWDETGRYEVSLAQKGRWQPSAGAVRAFWRKWGVEPVDPVPIIILKGRGLLYVVRRGST